MVWYLPRRGTEKKMRSELWMASSPTSSFELIILGT